MAIERVTGEFPIKEANKLVADLMKPDPKKYWPDFLISVTLGWTGFVLAVIYPVLSVPGLIGWAMATFLLYRAVLFTHELAHLKTGTFKVFRLVWNLLMGFPLLVPSFTYYGVHRHHHVHDVYGTTEDGEYLPFGAGNPLGQIGYLFLIFILPAFFMLRFMVLAPIGWLLPPVRKFVWQHFSSLTIDLTYVRALPKDGDPKFLWFAQEFMAFVYGWTVMGLVLSGVWPVKVFVVWYGVAVLMFLLNSLRTLAAHAYRNPGPEQLSMPEQFLDSVNVPGHRIITTLWAPVGLRFHATHHLYPRMPYHNLPIAHERLMEGLPDNMLYARANRKNLTDALVRLWQDAAQADREKNNGLQAAE